MSLARVHAMGLRGVEGYPVLVELALANGLPNFTTVGLPDDAVREARERVAAALRNSGYAMPNRRVTVNLSPARPRKQGSHYELPIALALLTASGQVAGGDWTKRWCVIGELSLDGRVQPVSGTLAMAARAKAEGFAAIMVPEANAEEARAAGLEALPVADLREAAELAGGAAPRPRAPAAPAPSSEASSPDLADVRGQFIAKRALELAAAGGHNLLLVGAPGTGKSMLARRLPGLLPPLTGDEALEVTLVQSACGRTTPGLVRERPFRAPHHGASAAALIGGGPSSRAGEVCLAHGGVLFLDELAEFSRPALEALRQPLEDRRVGVARARETVEYPARFTLVAAANPCPCGWRGHPRKTCVCSPAEIGRYLARLSGPLIDRIDLQIETPAVAFGDWAAATSTGESSAVVRARVSAARERQRARWTSSPAPVNAFVDAASFRRGARVLPEALDALAAAERMTALSARALDRVLRVARTIADLSQQDAVGASDVLEASSLRGLDRLRSNLEAVA
ncbi:MAG: YifB family Mg chelatase-like AAA ATPase [Elusimicrobia bacterium]|nr:YifB family Mg chelatase-like AAA ATPase [Elusimicrobiota bacterium]